MDRHELRDLNEMLEQATTIVQSVVEELEGIAESLRNDPTDQIEVRESADKLFGLVATLGKAERILAARSKSVGDDYAWDQYRNRMG